MAEPQENLHGMVAHLKRVLNTPVYALPVDVFRILVGMLSFFYFLQTLREVGDFSSPHGLLDHKLLQEIYWVTRLSLFQSGMGEPVFRCAYLLAMLASLLLVLGIRVKIIAVVLYVIAVSTYRWNFLVSNVEDGVMHLLLFWMILLPVGNTLTLREWITDGRTAVDRWKRQMVPGGAVHIFLGNLAMIYVVAGLWKWTSPLWRDGTALYVILKLPVSRAPEFWRPQHLPALELINYITLLTEPMLAVLIFLPARHALKWLLVPVLVGFHLGIVATLNLPFANVGMVGALVLIFRDELMQRVYRDARIDMPRASHPYRVADKLAIFVVACLAFQMLADIKNPPWRTPTVEAGRRNEEFATERVVADVLASNPFHAPLWMLGIAQSYRLFDWIDDRNFVSHYTVVDKHHGFEEAVDPGELFPSSLRSVLLQANLHGVTWAKIPESRRRELKQSIYARAAQRYCRRRGPGELIEVYATLERVTARSDSRTQPAPKFLLQFKCQPTGPRISYMLL